jgi:hypothetical protein
MKPSPRFARLHFVSSLLGRNDVDVVVLNDAGPLLYHRVLRDGERILSRDPGATTAREEKHQREEAGFGP